VKRPCPRLEGKAATVSLGGGPSAFSEIDVTAEPFVAIPLAIDGTQVKQFCETAADRLTCATESDLLGELSGRDRLAANELKSLVKEPGHR
jgi:hypothetical protein